MLIYKDIISEDEMFSDAFPMREIENGFLYEVEGKRTVHKDNIDESKFGANASAEEAAESCDTESKSGVNIVLYHRLQQTEFDQKSYRTYIKAYMKRLKEKLAEIDPEKAKIFEETAKKVVPGLIKRVKDFNFYTGENQNPDGIVGLLDYREDGITPYMLFFKDGLIAEKY